MLQSPGAPFPAGSPMLPDLSNMRYMSTGAKQLPPLAPLAPLDPKVESVALPQATASAMLHEIVTRTERRAGEAMVVVYRPHRREATMRRVRAHRTVCSCPHLTNAIALEVLTAQRHR